MFQFQIWPILDWGEDLESVARLDNEWCIPLAAVLVSFSWWECFVEEESPVPFVRWMHRLRRKMIQKTRYFTYLWVSALKMLVFFLVSLWIVLENGVVSDPGDLFSDMFKQSFNVHQFNVSEVQDEVSRMPTRPIMASLSLRWVRVPSAGYSLSLLLMLG